MNRTSAQPMLHTSVHRDAVGVCSRLLGSTWVFDRPCAKPIVQLEALAP